MSDDPDDDHHLSEEEGAAYLEMLVNTMAFAMAANDPEFKDREKVERGELPFPERYRVMAAHALAALAEEGWGYIGPDEPLDS
jgi:hypothetical protein